MQLHFEVWAILKLHWVLNLYSLLNIITGRFANVLNPQIKSLEPGLSNVLANSVSLTTSKTYDSYYKKWKAWVTQFPATKLFPADELYVALYLVTLLQSGFSFTTINLAFYSINFFHRSCGIDKLSHCSFLKAVLMGCKRLDLLNNRASKRKAPILPEHLDALVSKFAGPEATLSVITCHTLLNWFLRLLQIQ